MKLKTLSVFTFDELMNDVKQRVLDRERIQMQENGFPWYWDWNKTLREFHDMNPTLVLKDYDVERGFVKTEEDLSIEMENINGWSGARAWKWFDRKGWFELSEGDNLLTGFIADYEILRPIKDFHDYPAASNRTIGGIFHECYVGWVEGFQEDIEAWLSDESVEDMLENSWFLADGRNVTLIIEPYDNGEEE